MTDGGGGFELSGIPPGTNRLTVFFPGTDPASQDIEIGPEGSTGIHLQTGAEAALVAREIGGTSGSPYRRLRFSTSVETDEVFGERAGPGANEIEAFLNGPLPRGLAFNLGGTMTGQRSPIVGKGAADVPTYVYDRPLNVVEYPILDGGGAVLSELPGFIQFGGDCEPATNLDWMGNQQSCHGQRFPGNWTSDLEFEGRLAWTREGTTISFNRSARLDQSMHTSPFLFQSTGGVRNESSDNSARLRHRWESESGGALTIQLDFTQLNDNLVSGRIDPEFTWHFRHVDPPLGIETSRMPFEISPDRFSYDTGPGAVTTLLTDADWDQLILNTRTNQGTLTPFQNQLGRNRYPLPNWNPFGVTASFPAVGVDWGGAIDQRRRRRIRADVEWSPNRTHRFRIGGSRESARVRRFSSSSFASLPNDVFTGNPVTTGLFGYYRIAAASTRFEVGLSWYGFDSKAIFPIIPGRIITHPDFDPANPTSSAVWVPAESHTGIAPTARFGWLLPDERTALRISYEEQLTPPDFSLLMAGANKDFANVSTAVPFGSDVGFKKSVSMELGVRHTFGSWLVADLAGFRQSRPHDHRFLFRQRFDPFTDRIGNAYVLTDLEVRPVRGFKVRLEARISDVFRTTLEYRRLSLGPIGEQTLDSVSVAGVIGPFVTSIPAQEADDSTDVFSASLSLRIPPGRLGPFERFEVHGVVLLERGARYTRYVNRGTGVLAPGGLVASSFAEPLNASSLPRTKQVDVRIVRRVETGPVNLAFFANVTNLLGAGNVRQLFAETGELENPEFFRVAFYEPQVNILRNEAQASGWRTTVDRGGVTVDGVDLTGDCTAWQGGGGPIGCMMLIAAEQRFGNGDGIYDFVEFESAIRTWYNWIYGPQTLLGPGRHFSIGVQLDF